MIKMKVLIYWASNDKKYEVKSFNSLAELIEYTKEVGHEIIIRHPDVSYNCLNDDWLHLKGIDFEILVYDDYIE